MPILFVCTLLKVVSYYDLPVLSMSVMGFQKSLDGGGRVLGGVSSFQFYFGFLEYFNFARKAPKCLRRLCALTERTTRARHQ